MDAEKLKNLSKEEKLRLYDILQEKERRNRNRKDTYKPNEGQLPVHQSKATVRVVTSGNGCFAKGTPVMMLDGSTKSVEDVEVGDKVMGPDSETRTVKRLYRGYQPMYKVSPNDNSGDSYTCNEDHILTLQMCTNDHRYSYKAGDTVNLTVKEYLNLTPRFRRLLYGYRAPINFEEKNLILDPYLLGLWLGDGHKRGNEITTMDREIHDSFYKLQDIQSKDSNKASTYRIKDPGFKKKLKSLNLINNKHIPEKYLKSSREQRLNLLAGLLDTDGHLSKNSCFEITQKLENLSDDIVFLARSLGFKVKKSVKYVNEKPYYRVNILGEIWNIPVKLPHKKPSKYDLQRNPLRYKPIIEYVGEDYFYGFELDRDHRFLTTDCTVLHNSGKTTMAVNEAMWRAQGYNPITEEFYKVPARVAVVLDKPEKVNEVWLPELKKWYNIDDKQLHKRGRTHTKEITFDNGSVITFYSHDQDPMTFESIEVDAALFDEPCPEPIYTGLRRGGRKKGTQPMYLMIGTPLYQSWVRTKLIEPYSRGETTDIEWFNFSSDVNRDNVNWDEMESFFNTLTDHEKQVRRYGRFFDLEGLALAPLFYRDVHIISSENFQWSENNPCVLSIDPHPSKAHYAVLLGADRDDYIYVLEEMNKKEIPREFARSLRKMIEGYRVVDIVCDSLGSQDSTGGEGFKSFIQVLKEEGIQASSTTWKEKEDEAFVARIQDALRIPDKRDNFGMQVPKLRFLDKCIGCITDTEQVQWQQDKVNGGNKEKLDISHKDFLACIKYGLAKNLTGSKGKAKVYYRKPPKTYGGPSSKQVDRAKSDYYRSVLGLKSQRRKNVSKSG